MIQTGCVKRAARERFVWPGGYELYGLTEDGGILCYRCLRKEYRLIFSAMRRGGNPQWNVVAVDNAGAIDDCLLCDNCNAEVRASGCSRDCDSCNRTP